LTPREMGCGVITMAELRREKTSGPARSSSCCRAARRAGHRRSAASPVEAASGLRSVHAPVDRWRPRNPRAQLEEDRTGGAEDDSGVADAILPSCEASSGCRAHLRGQSRTRLRSGVLPEAGLNGGTGLLVEILRTDREDGRAMPSGQLIPLAGTFLPPVGAPILHGSQRLKGPSRAIAVSVPQGVRWG
jgi:hypothetical protein